MLTEHHVGPGQDCQGGMAREEAARTKAWRHREPSQSGNGCSSCKTENKGVSVVGRRERQGQTPRSGGAFSNAGSLQGHDTAYPLALVVLR